jgi:protoporphyrin/coproporphyrin ferrochelatase
MSSQKRIAVILFNLGGPDRPDAVRPFLFNLFNDANIIGAPAPIRFLLAHFIASRRAPKARDIYGKIGGGSPILANTQAQARALESALGDLGPTKVFVAMRYWHPMIPDAVAAVKEWRADEIVLLPLYPQFSTTTTGSSYRQWMIEAARQSLTQRQSLVCCYPVEPGFVAEMAGLTKTAIARAAREAEAASIVQKPFVIFSAHGLPKKIVDKGDPYVAQVEASVAAIVAALGMPDDRWRLAFQSRVGPLEWVGPSTESVILEQARSKRPIIIVPVAFVSEHSETLVELDIEYRHLAMEAGVPVFVRAPTVGAGPAFIAGLAQLARRALAEKTPMLAGCGRKACRGHAQCAMLKSGL